MATYLSDEWLGGPHDAIARAAAAAGVEVRLLHVVTGGPQKELRHGSRATADGIVETLNAEDEADLTLTCAFADGLALARRDVAPNVAYMRGRLKAAGDTGLLLRVLAACEGDAYEAASNEVAERTDG
jgi:hypothetical protein